MKRRHWLWALASGLGVAYLAVSWKADDHWTWFTGESETVVRVAEVKKTTRPIVLRFSGKLEPIQQVDVVSRLSGRLTEVRVKIGDTVQAGAPVATVYSAELAQRISELETTLDRAQKEVKEQENQLASAEKHFEKSRELYAQDLIARRDREQAASAATTARAQLELMRARLAQQEAMLTQARKLQTLTRLVAPIGGVVIRRYLAPGDSVNEAKAILTIGQLDTLKLTAEVPGDYSKDIRGGLPVRISHREASDLIREGTVARLESKLANQQQVLQLEIHLANTDRVFRPGASVDAILNLERQEEILWIPRAAMQIVADKRFVHRIVNGRAMRSEVKIETETDDAVVIRDGLKAGDAVILDWTGAKAEGARVRVAVP
jgi:RND family efflux transporter MFP subunit